MTRTTKKSRNACSRITARTSAGIASGCYSPVRTSPQGTANTAIFLRPAAASARRWASPNSTDPHPPSAQAWVGEVLVKLRFDLFAQQLQRPHHALVRDLGAAIHFAQCLFVGDRL